MILNTILKSYSFCKATKRIHYDVEIMNYFFKKKWRFLTKYYQNKIIYRYGCEIDPGAQIDKTVKFFHIVGVVIGDFAILKNNVSIFQNVTIGANIGINGQGSKSDMPIIEDSVIIYAGSVVVGGITIGNNSIVAANSTVTKNVPPNSLVTGRNMITKIEN
ncbi:serine acetyltransferase [Vibrio sp. S17_S38]|uniref:serine O-acetyltransferase n=1 Tax=Vibrio sp. S17_S38 TaxID=2720229 RepID=UPI00167FF0B3|nr:serine acetyltransferase [Vibrio sp. S17_S38]MBD1573280.1 serine acetyltransferase [Vibrio sp. S17_S38]